MPERGGLWGKAVDLVESKTGMAVVPKADLELKEAAWDELRAVNRELDLLGWHVLDYFGGQPQEVTALSRRRMVQRSRYVWMNDPQAGAAVSLMTDFTFGRGVPKPSAKDKTVQDVLDAFWTDPDNKRALTTYSKQVQLSTDLSLQCNIWFQVFDDGDDGKVKLSLVDHDTVENCVRDPQNPNRVLYWVIRPRPYGWDFQMDRQDTSIAQMPTKPLYYADWSGLQEAKDEETAGTRQKDIPIAPASRTGDGRVYHIAVNRYSGQQFGVPEMQRTIRWFSAYNDFMKARVDIAQASAAFIMKRKVKGTPSQLAKLASKAISRSGEISGGLDEGGAGTALTPPMVGSIINENDAVSHENFNLNSGAGNAQMDAHMIRAPISAATRWPQSYLGDESNSSLATATSLELPVLKAVESRQEVFEEMIRAMIDLVIERAVDTGQVSEERTPAEILTLLDPAIRAQIAAAELQVTELGHELLESHSAVVGSSSEGYTLRVTYTYEDEDGKLVEAHEDKNVDEEDTKRDLGYEFSMPSPLRRMMGDLVTACQTIAATFDPNNTNTELTRALATIVFGEALEIEDPADLVEKIWPPGYQDPLMAAQLQASQQPQQPNPFSPDAASQPFPGQDSGPPFGQPNTDYESTGTQFSQLPEQLRSGPYNAMEAARLLGEAVRDGKDELAAQLTLYLQEALRSKDDLFQSRVRSRQEVVDQLFDQDVTSVALDALAAVPGLQ